MQGLRRKIAHYEGLQVGGGALCGIKCTAEGLSCREVYYGRFRVDNSALRRA